MIWSREFWKATGERAISTGAQAALLAWGGGVLPSVSLPWWTIPAAFGGGLALGVLKALAALGLGNNGPSLNAAERVVK